MVEGKGEGIACCELAKTPFKRMDREGPKLNEDMYTVP